VAEGVDGINIATASGGQGQPSVFFVHATGFCKEVWNPVITALTTDPFSWMSMDLRGHGDSATGEFPHRWDLLGGDVLGVLDGRTGLVGVGHSCGGTALARAEVARPGTFRYLVLIEPIIFPTPAHRLDGPMSAVARKRRGMFESREAAKQRFRSGPFSDWTEASMDAYLDGGFFQTEEGFELKCSPEVEADYYAEGANHDTWDLIGSIEPPVMLIAGEHSDTHRDPYLSALAAQFQHVELHVLSDVGHLVPMEDPQAVAGLVDAVLGTV
jgi:pimeloyl-ACP methyl ester carboxylesterase